MFVVDQVKEVIRSGAAMRIFQYIGDGRSVCGSLSILAPVCSPQVWWQHRRINFYKPARLEPPSHILNSYASHRLSPTFSTRNGLLVDITDDLNWEWLEFFFTVSSHNTKLWYVICDTLILSLVLCSYDMWTVCKLQDKLDKFASPLHVWKLKCFHLQGALPLIKGSPHGPC